MSEKIKITNVTMKEKGALILQCDVRIAILGGLWFKEVRYFEKGQNYWIGLPCRSWKGDDDQWCYKELVGLEDADIKERLRKSICEEIRKVIEEGVDETPDLDEEIPF